MRKGQERKKPLRSSTLLLVLILAALMGINIAAEGMEKQQGWRRDYSFNSITTQSAKTLEILKGLRHPVHIYALFSKGQEDAPLMELLDRYTAANPDITWEQTDPGLHPEILSRYSTEDEIPGTDSLIVTCGETGKWKLVGPEDYVSLSMNGETGEYQYAGWTYEQAVTSAIAFVTRDESRKLTVLQGHGELDGTTLAPLGELLSANQIEISYADPSDPKFEPDPKDILAVLSPMRDVTGEELQKLLSFASEGGSFLFTCDYTDPIQNLPNWSALLRSYGFIPLDGIVTAGREEPDTYYNQNRIQILPEVCSTDLTVHLIASGAVHFLLPGTRAFETPKQTDRSLTAFEVLRSGKTAYLKNLNNQATSMEPEETDPRGPFSLALSARRVTDGGYVSRAFILGCSALLTSEQLWAITDTRPLISRVISFLMDSEGITLEIEPRNALRPGLRTDSLQTGAILLTALPILTAGAALLILRTRKRRT